MHRAVLSVVAGALAPAGLLTVVFATPAHAGTLTFQQARADTWWEFRAAPGERNDIRVEYRGGAYLITDKAALPTGCPAVGPNTVRCTGGALQVYAGDGDDIVRGAPYANGGPGDDRLIGGDAWGGTGDDVLVGSRDEDGLNGGPGRDRISGLGGDDDISNGEIIDGGPGTDTLKFPGAKHGVTVDVSRLHNIENVNGTRYGDVLIGDDHANLLEGYGGHNRIEGRGGNDILDGVGVLRGGPGDDFLSPSNRSEVACGPGRDTVDASASGNSALTDCERATGDGYRVVIGARWLTVFWDKGYDRPCSYAVNGRVTKDLHGQSFPWAPEVRVRPGKVCEGGYIGHFAPITFRLTSPTP
jgi:Ca2+-binding RTX toxin-like protein